MEYRNNLKNIFFSLTISALAEEKAKELETQARYTRYRRNVHELFSLTVEIHPVNANNSFCREIQAQADQTSKDGRVQLLLKFPLN